MVWVSSYRWFTNYANVYFVGELHCDRFIFDHDVTLMVNGYWPITLSAATECVVNRPVYTFIHKIMLTTNCQPYTQQLKLLLLINHILPVEHG